MFYADPWDEAARLEGEMEVELRAQLDASRESEPRRRVPDARSPRARPPLDPEL